MKSLLSSNTINKNIIKTHKLTSSISCILFGLVICAATINTKAETIKSECYYAKKDYRALVPELLLSWDIFNYPANKWATYLAIEGSNHQMGQTFVLRFRPNKSPILLSIDNVIGTIKKPRRSQERICDVPGPWNLKLESFISESQQEWSMKTTEKFAGLNKPITIKLLCDISISETELINPEEYFHHQDSPKQIRKCSLDDFRKMLQDDDESYEQKN